MRNRIGWGVGLLLLFSTSAFAQDFGAEWLDRVTHELRKEPPLTPKAVDLQFFAGALYYYDSNVFLRENNKLDDSILVGYFRARVDYTEKTFDAAADLLVNYKYYFDLDDASDDEERFYGRIRYVGSKIHLEVAQVLRRESDPTDAVFIERAERVVSSTYPRIWFNIVPEISVEATAGLHFVRFEDDAFDSLNNFNLRTDLAVIGHWFRGFDLLVQAGYLSIDYSDSTAPPDADGYYFRAGYRGEEGENLYLTALVGYTRAKSDGDQEHSTMDVEASLHYKWTQTLTLRLGYNRGFGFSGGASSFQTVDRITLSLEDELASQVKGGIRFLYDRIHAQDGVVRYFYSIAGDLSYRVLEYLSVVGGVTYRAGNISEGAPENDFDDWIFHLGVVGTF